MEKSLFAATGTIAVAIAVTLTVLATPASVAQVASPTAGTWTVVQSPITSTLHAVALVDPGPAGGPVRAGWAVGDGGAIARYHEGAWLPVPSQFTATLRDVAVSATGDAWAVGDDGTVLHFAENRWGVVPSPPATDFTGVSVGMDGTVMATGNAMMDGEMTGRAYHLESDGLREELFARVRDERGPAVFTDVAVWNTYYWAVIGTLSTQWGPGEVVIIQDCEEPTEPPPWIGSTFCWGQRSHRGGYGVYPPLAVDLVARDQFMIAGRRGAVYSYSPRMNHYPVTVPVADYRDVAMAGPNEAWLAASKHQLVHVSGDRGEWVTVAGARTSASFTAVDAVATGEGWAVGGNGLMAQLLAQRPVRLYLPWCSAQLRVPSSSAALRRVRTAPYRSSPSPAA